MRDPTSSLLPALMEATFCAQGSCFGVRISGFHCMVQGLGFRARDPTSSLLPALRGGTFCTQGPQYFWVGLRSVGVGVGVWGAGLGCRVETLQFRHAG